MTAGVSAFNFVARRRFHLAVFAIGAAIALILTIALPALARELTYGLAVRNVELEIQGALGMLFRPGELDAPLRNELRLLMDRGVAAKRESVGLHDWTLYGPSGFIAYSSDPERVGQRVAVEGALARALQGERVFSSRAGPTESGYPNWLYTIVPVRTADGQIIGALEAVSEGGLLFEHVASVQRTIIASVVIGFALVSAVFVVASDRRQRQSSRMIAAVTHDRDESERRSRRLELTVELIRIISAGLDESAAFQAVATELHKLLSFDYLSVAGTTKPGGPLVHLHAEVRPGAAVRLGEAASPESHAVRAYRDGEVIVVDDLLGADRTDRERAVHRRLGIRSLACIPMVHQGVVIGVLSLGHAEPGQFTEEDIRDLQPVARALGAAIAHARLYRDAIRAREHAEAMLDIGSALTSELEYETVLQRIASHAVQLAGARFAFVAVPGKDRFRPATVAGDDQGFAASIYITDDPESPYGRGPDGEAARTRQPTVIADVTSDPRCAPWLEALLDRGIRSTVSVPLVARDRLVGILAAYSDQVGWFDDDRVAVLASFGTLAEIAVENARLFTEVGQVEAIRELVRLRTEFVSLVTHELRNPLAAVTGWTEVLLARSSDPQLVRTAATELDRHSRHLQRLVEDLLDISRFDSNRFQLDRRPFDFIALIQSAVRDAEIAFASHRFELCVEPDLPVCSADPVRLRQVLDNLLSNACRYSDVGSSVVVEARRGRRRGELLVRVRDEGIGLEPDQLERVFSRFYRGARPEIQAIPGSGLGLALCRAIVEAHGGTIWAESPGLGAGSAFNFALPSGES